MVPFPYVQQHQFYICKHMSYVLVHQAILHLPREIDLVFKEEYFTCVAIGLEKALEQFEENDLS